MFVCLISCLVVVVVGGGGDGLVFFQGTILTILRSIQHDFTKRETADIAKIIYLLAHMFQDKGRRKVLFEVGCGVGNFMFPLLEEDETKSLFVYACDFSKRAVQFVKVHTKYINE